VTVASKKGLGFIGRIARELFISLVHTCELAGANPTTISPNGCGISRN
jgi:hypothetical protein